MLLSTLLYKANSCVPGICDREFYEIKERLLRDRHDRLFQKQITQRIEHECWDCDGDGCDRCEESGLYETVYVLHNQYKWHGHTFLLPELRTHLSATPTGWPEPEIEGTVRHKMQRSSWNAHLWLLLLFDRHTFWHVFSYYHGYSDGSLSAIQCWYVRSLKCLPFGFSQFSSATKTWRLMMTKADSLKVHRIRPRRLLPLPKGYLFDAFWRSLQPSYQDGNEKSAPWFDDIPF